MRPQNLPLMLLAAGLVASVMLSRKASGDRPDGRATGVRAGPRRFTLQEDAPSLGFARGESLVIEPEALIRVGDVVALKSENRELVLTRFHDELMHCVEGLVVRESALSAH